MRGKIILALVLVGVVFTLAPVSVFADECVWVQLRNGDIVRLDRSKTVENSGQTYYRGCGLTFDTYPVNDVSFYGSASVGRATADIYCVGVKIPPGSTFVITRERPGRIYIWWKGYERDCPTPDYVIVGAVFLNQIWDYDGSSVVGSEQSVVTATPQPSIATPIPSAPLLTPVSTNTLVPPRPTSISPTATVVVARVTVVPINPPQPTPTAVTVVPTNLGAEGESFSDKIGSFLEELGSFLLNCVLFIVGCLVLYGFGWCVNAFRKVKQEEKLDEKARVYERKEREKQEATNKFNWYVEDAKNALRKGDLNAASKSIEMADALRGVDPDGVNIVTQLSAQLNKKKIEQQNKRRKK